MLEILIDGLLLGGLYTLLALGLSVMFGVMRLTNIAQGDFIVAAAFGAIGLQSMLGHLAGLMPLLILPVAFVLGHQLQTHILNRTMGKNPLPSLVVTFGLSIILQNALLEIFSADPRSIDTAGFNTQSIELVNISIGVLPLCILILALCCTAGLQWLFSATALGRSFRAVSDDPEIAQLMGLKPRRVYAMATGLSFGLIALAGMLQAMRVTVAPADGPALLIFAFEAVIIGGLGSFWGTFFGATILGLTQQIGFSVDPGWGLWFGHLVFLAVLVVRPQGLFPKTKG